MKRVIRDRLVATPCGAANRYLATGLDQRKTQRALEDARRVVTRAGELHDQRGDATSETRLARAVRTWEAAREANRWLNIEHLNAQAAARVADLGAVARVDTELKAMWTEHDARPGVYADAAR
uniref:hypothetical protein n=1 Tax=Streptosporangium sp. CA-235898 TaxID=3240073 RepID=UPI003F491576